MRRMLNTTKCVYKRHGSVWTYTRNYMYGIIVLETDGGQFIHKYNGPEKGIVNLFTYDERGCAVTMRRISRQYLYALIMDMRENKTKTKSQQQTKKKQ